MTFQYIHFATRRLAISLILFLLFFMVNPSIAQIFGPEGICNTSVNYTYTAPIANSYNWSIDGGNIISGGRSRIVTVRWTTTTLGRLDLITIGDKYESESNEYTLEVNIFQGGTVSGPSSVYAGARVDLNLSGYNGPIHHWESSIDGVNWTNVSHTGAIYTINSLYQTTTFRAAIGNTTCTIYSSPFTVNVSYSGGSLSGPAYACPTVRVNLSLSGHSGPVHHWESKVGNGSWTIINNTTTTYSVPSLSQTTSFKAAIGTSTANMVYSSIHTVNILGQPAGPIAADVSRRGPGSVTLTASGGNGSIYFWYTSSEGGSPIATGASYTTPPLVATTTYYVSTAGIYSCESNRTAVSAIVLPDIIINSITTNIVQTEGIKDENDIPELPVENNTQTISYIDGLGRSMQLVTKRGSPLKQDLVQIIDYDAFGRENKKYLPYTGGNDGQYKDYAYNALMQFYSNSGSNNDRSTTTKPWSEIIFEPSPLNRVKEQGAPGEAWQPGTNHTLKNGRRPNSEGEVRLWNYDFTRGQVASAGYYAPGELWVEEIEDEDGHKTFQYKDKQDRVVLVKKVLSLTESAQTYYVFDSFSRLRMIVQPEGIKELQLQNGIWKPDSSFISKWCFIYKYDKLGRMSEKVIPGAEPVYMVYNKRNQLILSQDGNQRQHNRWNFLKYDALQRVVLTGVYTHSNRISQNQMQQAADLHNQQYEIRTSDNFATQYGYTINQSFPALNAGNSKINIVNHYDDYDYDYDYDNDADFLPSGLSTQPVKHRETTGLMTGTRIRILGNNQLLLTSLFYDKYRNTIQQQKQNHLGGSDVVTNLYDFTGKLIETEHKHNIEGSALLTIRKRHQYDHAGRLLNVQQQINNDTWIMMSASRYNEIGQLAEKRLHSTDNGQTFLQKTDYRYNIRGWLTKINDAALTESSDLFGMELTYDQPLISGSTPVFSGNISEIIVNNKRDTQQKAYSFIYDQLGRLTNAHYMVKGSTHFDQQIGAFDEGGIIYDLNGNIQRLQRYAISNDRINRELIHDFTYGYQGNRLINLYNSVESASLTETSNEKVNEFGVFKTSSAIKSNR